MSFCVNTGGARLLSCLIAAGFLAGSLLATFDDAEARGKRKFRRHARPAISSMARAPASFTSASNYAALVIDAKTGKVLFEKNADARRFPASITKVMTLYLVFEDLERGRFKLDSRITMSARASAQPPTKLGLRPGSTVRIDDAIKALVTKSANDVAYALAENLEGSESAFADRMTRKARALGMSETTFRNASGLPNPSHVTTAHDLVVLGRAIQDRFPRYYGYFGTRVFTYAGRNMPNHNRLLGQVDGIDGIKTGYTNASGFNLLSSVKSNGRSVVAVVMGGRSGASRDAHMRELLALNLPKASNGSRVAPLVAEVGERAPTRVRVAALPTPLQAAEPAARIAALDEAIPTPASAPLRSAAAQPAPLPEPAPRAVAATTSPAPAPRITPADSRPAVASAAATTTPQTMRWVVGAPATTGSVGAAGEPSDLPPEALAYAEAPAALRPARGGRTPSPDIEGEPQAAPVAERQPTRKGWIIQIGATTEADKAKALLSDARSKGGRMLTSAEAFTEVYTKGDTTFYRARFAGLNERSADAACKALKRSSMSCFAIKN